MNHPQKIITKCDGISTNCDSLVYYKVRWTVITNCDSFFITKCDTVYYKLRQVLQSAMNLCNISHKSFRNTITGVYHEIVHFMRNIFNVQSGRAGKAFIEELTFWIKQFNSNSDLNSVALKAFMVLPTLILQKPSATSKSKEHSAAIERR